MKCFWNQYNFIKKFFYIGSFIVKKLYHSALRIIPSYWKIATELFNNNIRLDLVNISVFHFHRQTGGAGHKPAPVLVRLRVELLEQNTRQSVRVRGELIPPSHSSPSTPVYIDSRAPRNTAVAAQHGNYHCFPPVDWRPWKCWLCSKLSG